MSATGPAGGPGGPGLTGVPDELAADLGLLRLRAEAAFLARLNAGSGFADPRAPTQIHLLDPAASARLGRAAARPSDTHRRQAAEVAAAIAAAEAVRPATGDGSRLGVAATRLGLTPAEAALLRLAAAYAIDRDTRELVHAMAGRRRPALYLDVAAEILPALAAPPAVAAALHPRGPLREGEWLGVGDEPAPAVALARRLIDWLLGDDRLPPPLDDVAALGLADPVWIPPAVADEVAAIATRVAAAAEPVAILIQGARGSGRRAVAHALAARLGHALLGADLGELLAADGKPRGALVRVFLAEARLRAAVPYLGGVEALVGEREVERGAIAALRRGPSPLVLGGSGRGVATLPLGRPFHLVRMPRADLDDRARAWQASLAAVGAAVPAGATVELAGRYVLGPGAIAEVTREASGFAAARGAAVDRDTLEEAVTRRLSIQLGAFGSVLTRKARFDEMVLPADVVLALRDMIAMVGGRAQILERWGYQRHLGISRGVSALFSGEPGTGKTMAASVIASELGLELIRIDLSQVVSKWVGETEKNLGRIFDEAQDAAAMLLFDEADALFGKRTDVKSAQDRYANLEVNYILQRMETFDGVSVLTTNLESSIDQALQRRLNFRVRFPEPEVEERALLWRKLLPPETALADAPFERLAERFEMTGGYIKNAIVRAAVIAAREGRGLTVDDLWTGAHNEYAEMGKVLSSLTRT
ncbi:MAG: ATP-binding protein [Myxococcales bacterium]|nr:ATP-binding protein [Myxococcales bacterium]